jgi:hypothetical protein
MYGIVGKSRVDGYQTQGVVAGIKNLSAGIGFVSRPWRFHRFLVGGFVQATYSGSRTHALEPDVSGAIMQYNEFDRDPLVTIGPDVEYLIPRTPLWVVVRPGKNFGAGLAANTAGGFSLNIGVLIDPIKIKQYAKKLRF